MLDDLIATATYFFPVVSLFKNLNPHVIVDISHDFRCEMSQAEGTSRQGLPLPSQIET